MRGAVRIVAAGLGAFSALAFGASALAGKEQPCASQYSLDEQLMLEWAALGGDPHAQFALSQCALPEGRKDLSPSEKAYAVTWVTLAACDAVGADDVAARDRRTRRLKAQGDLSFRRFSGTDDDEDLSRKDKRFVEYREHKTKELMIRMRRLKEVAGPADFDVARAEIADQFARFGELGRMRLATLAACPHLDAPDSFVAAAWASAADAWESKRATAEGVYGDTERKGWSYRQVADERVAELDELERATFRHEKQAIDRYEIDRLAEVESEAALARLGELKTLQGMRLGEDATVGEDGKTERRGGLFGVGRNTVDVAFEGPSVTIATQYALEALGFIEFVNGPDNDYGPSTIEAVGKAQAQFGGTPTRWMSHREVRQTVCRAALEAADPVSYFHVGAMYLRGQGYARQLAKARFALDRADVLIRDALANPSTLASWKAAQYPAVRAEIARAKAELTNEWSGLPAAAKVRMDAWSPGAEPLCE